LWPLAAIQPTARDLPRGLLGGAANGALFGAFALDGTRLVIADASGGLVVYGIPLQP
jgi:hypothetical protein